MVLFVNKNITIADRNDGKFLVTIPNAPTPIGTIFVMHLVAADQLSKPFIAGNLLLLFVNDVMV